MGLRDVNVIYYLSGKGNIPQHITVSEEPCYSNQNVLKAVWVFFFPMGRKWLVKC